MSLINFLENDIEILSEYIEYATDDNVKLKLVHLLDSKTHTKAIYERNSRKFN